jgi:hypothetical protein
MLEFTLKVNDRFEFRKRMAVDNCSVCDSRSVFMAKMFHIWAPQLRWMRMWHFCNCGPFTIKNRLWVLGLVLPTCNDSSCILLMLVLTGHSWSSGWGGIWLWKGHIYFGQDMGARWNIYFHRYFAWLKYFTYDLVLILAPNYEQHILLLAKVRKVH